MQGLLIDAEMVAAKPDPSYVMAGEGGCERLARLARLRVGVQGGAEQRESSGPALHACASVRTQRARPRAVYEMPATASGQQQQGQQEAQQGQGQQEGRHVGLTRLGVCAADVASGHVLLGEFVDDEVRMPWPCHP